MFNIAVKDSDDFAFLTDSKGVQLASEPGETEVIGIGVDCLSDEHCEQVACQTGACINYACVYENAAQGTPCDDGQFCTETDTCDGNGNCVGSGNPCPSKWPKCCEGEEMCVCSLCPCNF